MMRQTEDRQSILSMQDIHKSFSGVQALKGVSLELYPGEILGLIGENGAGKSTLMRILMGIEKRDQGVIAFHGQALNLAKPIEAHERGIGMVFQEQALFPNLSVAENIFLGHDEHLQTMGYYHWKKMYSETEMILEKVNLSGVSPKTKLSKLSFSQRQMVEVARVLYSAFHTDQQIVIILDEPTAVLSPGEVRNLFKVIRSLREHAAFVFISHHLDEIVEYTDRVAVLKDGANVGEKITAKTDVKTLQEMMVGREFSADFFYAQELREPDDEIILGLEGVTGDEVRDVSFTMRKGEILGIAGLMGCGKEDLAKIIFGDSPLHSGSITVQSGTKLGNSIGAAVSAGLGYLPSDRRNEGILENLSVAINTTIANLDNYKRSGGFIDRGKEQEAVQEYIRRLSIKTPSGKTKIVNLSGGNQQKVILARWLIRKPKILLMEQPTRGIDVGSKQEIYKLMRELANQDLSILVMSDEMPELIGLCNRIIMMRQGVVTGEMDCQKEEKPNEQEIIKYIT